MNCVLFAEMDQVFSKENKTFKKILENWKKNTGKVREFCQSGKVGTMTNVPCSCTFWICPTLLS